MALRNALLLASFSFVFVHGSRDLGFTDDSDLTHFVSRPDIKAPILDVKVHDEDSVEPGYIFLGPYASIYQPQYPPKYYQTCQTGPAIYDSRGELVWTGACAVRNQNACDFRAFQTSDGSYRLSTILHVYGADTKGHGIIMDDSYNIIDEVHVPHEMLNMNMHELKFMDNGTRGLHIIYQPEYVDVSDLNLSRPAGWVANLGFREINTETSMIDFEWWALDHIDLTESTIKIDNSILGPHPNGWNWLHINSVDKNTDGDYIMSARFTDAIYKISGKDGSILWRLGGTNSSFTLDGFNFSRQHDARWIKYNDEKEIISFLDNASDDMMNGGETSSVSSALIVELDKTTEPMTAKVLKRRTRPDGQLSRLRGNAQNLPGSNTFVGWADNAIMTEYSSDDRPVLEAQFRSNRFVTYRSYKLPFVGNPMEPPDMKALAFGVTPATSTTVMYVSWNGATEVASWKFYSKGGSQAGPKLIGTAKRSGFETVFQYTGLETTVFAMAIAADGTILGRTEDCSVVLPSGYGRTTEHDDDDEETKVIGGVKEYEKQVRVQAPTAHKTDL